MHFDALLGREGPRVGRSRPTVEQDDRPHRVRAIGTSAIFLVDVDVANDGPATPKPSQRHPYGLALIDDKMQPLHSVDFSGHLRRGHADTVGVLVTAFAPPYTRQVGPPDPALRGVRRDALTLQYASLAVRRRAAGSFPFLSSEEGPCQCSTRRAPG
jgi:hypothetical protein